jgi:predicted permease
VRDRPRRPARSRRGLVFWQPSVDDEVRGEIDFHLEMRTRDLVAGGLTPEAARTEALRRFGRVDTVARECAALGHQRDHAMQRSQYLADLRQDLALALRTLRRAPAVALTAVLMLAVGIGATSAIFGALYAVVLRPLPFPDQDRIVLAAETWAGQRSGASPGTVATWRRETRSFEALAPMRFTSFNLAEEQTPERVVGARVGDGFFRAFGIRPALGRTFLAEEDQPGRANVVVLSHRLWERRFGADPRVVGRTVTLSGAPHTIVGVAPAWVDYTSDSEELWVPLALTSEQLADYGEHSLTVVGRLRPGVSLAQAEAEIAAVTQRVVEREPRFMRGRGSRVERVADVAVEDYRPRLLTLLGAVGLVLLIACGNVANLLLARGVSRAREVALRAALGAGRGRIVRQLLAESLAIALGGAALGLALAHVGLKLLVTYGPEGVPRLADARVDGAVVACALVLALVSSVVAGLIPALRASRPALSAALRAGGRGVRQGGTRDRVRAALVVGEVALALTLLVGAGLLVRSARALERVDPGFEPRGLLTARVTLPRAEYADAERVKRAFVRMAEELAARPGVAAAAAATAIPLGAGGGSNGLFAEGKPELPEHMVDARRVIVTPGYFATVGVRLRRGRLLTAQDVDGATRVAVISETVARRMWPGEDPIGRRFSCCEGDTPGRWKEVVGVVADVHSRGLREQAPPEFYLPVAQAPAEAWEWSGYNGWLVARGAGPAARDPAALAAAVRAAVQAVDRTVPVFSVETMPERLRGSLAQSRFNTALLTLLGAAGLALAAAGVYGVLAYLAGQRRQEIGVRLTLGATARDVLVLVARQGLVLVLAGVAVGAVGALAAARALDGVLFGVSRHDPLTFAAVAGLLVAVGGAASLLPAHRATRVDAAVVLRDD